MTARIPVLYNAAEMKAALDALQNNHYHKFELGDAIGIIRALHLLGFKIVKVGTNK